MRRYVNWFLNGFAITFAVPSFLIIISWNAIPGDHLYGIKTGLEKVALGVTIKTPLASILSVKYTERRFSEANTLLTKKGSTLGYNLLVAETKNSKTIIVDKKDKSQAKELVAKIEEYQKKIAEKKLAIETGTITIPVAYAPPQATSQPYIPPQPGQTPAPTTTPKPVYTPAATPASTDEITAGTTDEILDDLEQTDKDLEEIKEEVRKVAQTLTVPTTSATPLPAGDISPGQLRKRESLDITLTPQPISTQEEQQTSAPAP